MANTYSTTALKLGDNTFVNTLPYVVCGTLSSSQTKVVTVGDFALEKGATINVKFSNTNTADSPKLQIGSKTDSARDIYYKGERVPAKGLKVNRIYTFVYNGNQWDLVGDLKEDYNTAYYNVLRDMTAVLGDGGGKIIVVPDGATSIDIQDDQKDNVEIVATPASVTSIGENVFYGCSSLTSVVIPDSVTSIGYGAFGGCRSLKSVVIGDSVTSIGSYAFWGCDSLTSVVIPNSVTSISGMAFYECSRLTEITLPFVGETKGGTSNTHFGDIFGASSYLDNYNYVPTSLKKVTITGGKIDYGAFYGCSSLTSVVMGDSVTSIGYQAFHNCDGLTSITIPNSVTSIGDCAFENCSSLTSVYYKGTKSDWYKITIGSYNDNLTYATRYYYSENKPTDTTTPYWHYVGGVPTSWYSLATLVSPDFYAELDSTGDLLVRLDNNNNTAVLAYITVYNEDNDIIGSTHSGMAANATGLEIHMSIGSSVQGGYVTVYFSSSGYSNSESVKEYWYQV